MDRRSFISKAAATGLIPTIPAIAASADPAGGVDGSDVIDRIFRTVNNATFIKGFGGFPDILVPCGVTLKKMNPDMSVSGEFFWHYKDDPRIPLAVHENWDEILRTKFLERMYEETKDDFHRENLGPGISSLICRMENQTHDLRLELNVIVWDWLQDGVNRMGFNTKPVRGKPLGSGAARFSIAFNASGSYKRDPINLQETPLKKERKEKLYDAVVPQEDSKTRET